MKYISLLLIFALLFLAVKCPKQDNPPAPIPTEVLPPITQKGAGTFGFLLNGQVWLPNGVGESSATNTQYYHGRFTIGAQKNVYNPNNQPIVEQLFLLGVMSVYDTGKYYIKSVQGNPDLGGGFLDDINKCTYISNNNDSLQNWVHITRLDTSNLIVSGTFNLYFTTLGCDTLRITNGRFDMKYEY